MTQHSNGNDAIPNRHFTLKWLKFTHVLHISNGLECSHVASSYPIQVIYANAFPYLITPPETEQFFVDASAVAAGRGGVEVTLTDYCERVKVKTRFRAEATAAAAAARQRLHSAHCTVHSLSE